MTNQSNDRFLPLGTIVKLKTGKKKLMITGFCLYDDEHGHVFYDYCGCMYPEGMLSNREANLFNHGDIEEVLHLGVSDEEDKAFKINLTSMIQIMETVNPTSNTDVVDIKDPNYQEE